MFFLSWSGLVEKQKTRDCFGNRGLVENRCRLEIRSHAARMTGDARPNGHAAIGGHVQLQLFGK
ncbi:MAG TPA: hypothetical protein VIK53_11475 [Verrucomicrobiae bacterium]